VIVGEDEDLGLTGETAKGGRMKNSVTVALKTCSEFVGFFGPYAVPGTVTPRRTVGEQFIEPFFTNGQ
jgi:hypothetical protein